MILSLSNGENNFTFEPSEPYIFTEIQTYKEGKHQTGTVEIVSFKRGYDYYIKIDDEINSLEPLNRHKNSI